MDARFNNQPNPLAPSTTPTVQEQLALYRAMYTQEQKAAKEEYDVFTPNFTEAPEQIEDNSEDWLAPISVNTSPLTAVDTRSGSQDYVHFQEAFENDEAVQEIAEPMMGVAQQLRQAIEAGEMTYEEAMQKAVQLMDSYVIPVLDKVHGDRAKSRTLLSRSPAEVAESFGAEVQKYADGKGQKPKVSAIKQGE